MTSNADRAATTLPLHVHPTHRHYPPRVARPARPVALPVPRRIAPPSARAWLALIPTMVLLVVLVAGRVDYTGWAATAQAIEQFGILVVIGGIVWHFLLRPKAPPARRHRNDH